MSDPIIGIVSLLESDTALAAIVGTNIQPIPAPEDYADYPAVTYQVVSEVQTYTFTGPDSVNTIRVVFDCFSPVYAQARGAANEIKSLLTGYSGVLSDGTQIYEAEIVTVQDGWEDGSRMYKCTVHVLVVYGG